MKKDTEKNTEETLEKPMTITKQQLMECLAEIPDDAEILCKDEHGAVANIISFSKTYLITGKYRYTINVNRLSCLQQNRTPVESYQKTCR